MTAILDRLVCAVMAGGSGTRFWPLSRKDEPKQLLKFFGDKTLLRVTVDRIAPLCLQPLQTLPGLLDQRLGQPPGMTGRRCAAIAVAAGNPRALRAHTRQRNIRG